MVAVTLRQVADETLGPLLHVGQTFKPTTDNEGDRIDASCTPSTPPA